MIRLFYVPRTRASRPRWLLEELEIPYELVRLDPRQGETRSEAHTRRHPLQHVPVLETDHGTIFESAAIALHLADLYPERRLLPPPGTHERGLAYQWTFYAMAELEPGCIRLSELSRAGGADGADAAAARQAMARPLAPLDTFLSRQDYLLPSGFSVADIVLGSVVSWAKALGAVEGLPGVSAWLTRLKARPAWKRATAD